MDHSNISSTVQEVDYTLQDARTSAFFFLRHDFLGLCSHTRAIHYYIHSIREPFLFPSNSCPSVEECNQEIVVNNEVSFLVYDEI